MTDFYTDQPYEQILPQLESRSAEISARFEVAQGYSHTGHNCMTLARFLSGADDFERPMSNDDGNFGLILNDYELIIRPETGRPLLSSAIHSEVLPQADVLGIVRKTISKVGISELILEHVFVVDPLNPLISYHRSHSNKPAVAVNTNKMIREYVALCGGSFWGKVAYLKKK